jgi:hypothetical protein
MQGYFKFIHPRCVSDNKNHSRLSQTQQLIYSVSTEQKYFGPTGHHQVAKKWKFKYAVLNGNWDYCIATSTDSVLGAFAKLR